MPSNRDRLIGASPRSILFILVLLVAQTAFGPAVTATPDEHDPSECVETLSSEPGGVPVTVERGPVENSVTLSVDTTENQSVLDSLWIELPPGATLKSKTGFERHSSDFLIYETVEDAQRYSLTYTFEENGTTNANVVDSKLRPFEGENEWAVAPLPVDYHGISAFHAPSNAAIGQRTVYFGDYSETTATNGCHRIRLVVSEAVDLNRNRSAILDSLQYTDRHLGGQRYDEVTIFVSPENFSAGYAGVARSADIVVSGTGKTLGESDGRWHIWLHEYIHTRQSYHPTGDFEWWTEASANYLSIRMGYRSGYLSAGRYNRILSHYGENKTGDAVLANKSTWRHLTPYNRGVLALARLDTALRGDTNGSVTVAAVFNATERDQPETHSEFMALLEKRSGNQYNEWSDDYIRGTTAGELKMKAETLPDYTVGIVVAVLLLLVGLYFEREDTDSEEASDAE